MREPNAGRVMRVYRSATAAQVAAGLAWYSTAHDVAAELDPDDVRRAAGVIAALSPRTRWERNLEMARAAYKTGTAAGGLTRCCDQANAILAGGDPLDVLTGPKVRAFFQLIADPTDEHTVCVDRHAIDVAIGVRLEERDRAAYHLDRNGLYERFAECYRRAADRLGVLPWQAQGVTWGTWRERFGVAAV